MKQTKVLFWRRQRKLGIFENMGQKMNIICWGVFLSGLFACTPEKPLIEGEWELIYAHYYNNSQWSTTQHSYAFEGNGRFAMLSNGQEDQGNYWLTNDSLWTNYDVGVNLQYKIWMLNDTHLYLKQYPCPWMQSEDTLTLGFERQ
jgi:hypothetical protein